jgi:anaerobic selenocysteine-containing dehydrogenase
LSECVILWGKEPLPSNPDGLFGHALIDMMKRGTRLITVDPRLTWIATKADYALRLRPGTDAAMALGWMNVIVNNKLYSEKWVKRWTDLPYLVVEDMDPTPGATGALFGGAATSSKLLKESDIKKDGSQDRFMCYDSISKKLVWHDCKTGYWQGEKPLKIKHARELPGHDAVQPNLIPGTSQGYVPDLSDFSRCDPVIDPSIDCGEITVTLKDGSKHKAKPAWAYFVEHLSHYDPQTVAEITGVDAELITKAATTYATPVDPTSGYGNGGIAYELAEEHACNSVQNCRALDALVGLTNNFDTPAGNRGPSRTPFNTDQWDMGFEHMIMPMPMYPGYDVKHAIDLWNNIAGGVDIPMLKQLGIWADTTGIWDCCNRAANAQYPIYGGVCQSGDVMNMSNSQYGWNGIKNMEFFLDLDLWHTPTSQLADVLLPVRHWLEVDCPRASQGSGGMDGSICKTVEPLAETWFDTDIVIQLCKHMGIPWHLSGTTDETKWPDSVKDMDDTVMPYIDLIKGYPGDSPWEKWKNYFQEQGMQEAKVLQPDAWGSYRRFESGVSTTTSQPIGGLPTLVAPGVNTPTRKQEIWSTIIESYHTAKQPFSPAHDRIHNFSRPDEKSADLMAKIGPFTLPTYTEPPESPISDPDLCKTYPYIMTTGRRIPVYFHSEHRQLPWCREMWPVPRMEINPTDAAKLGINQGDWVWIETQRGKIREVADLYYGIRPGTINAEHQWWMPEYKGAMKGYDQVGINILVNKDLRDPICGSSYVRAYNVNIYKATAANSPNGDPCPQDIDGQEMIHDPNDERLKAWLPVIDNDDSMKNYAERNNIKDE